MSRTESARQVLVSRIATVAFGVAGTILAANVSRIGTLLEIANKLINAFTGPLFGIYLLAMFSQRATSTPVLVAGLIGTLTSYYVAYQTAIGFMWPSTFGLAATWLVGYVLSILSGARPDRAARELTWHRVMAAPSKVTAASP
jgi:ABC-type Co2+ transport system permease subunit